MNDIDAFANSLLEEAKRFLEKAAESQDDAAQTACLHAALMLAFCSLEAHVNAVADEVAQTRTLSPHDAGVILEREVHLDGGEFKLGKRLKIFRLEDRILHLHRVCSSEPLDPTAPWRPKLSSATTLRNGLTHPKEVPNIGFKSVTAALEAVINTIDALYTAVFKKGLPAANRGLQSKLTF